MRTLYHFQYSPFSRRTRLALAFKGLECELRDGRANPAYGEEAKKLWPFRTCPVLVEEDGRALGDSVAIARYLDAAYPAKPLWPTDAEGARTAAEIVALVDGTLNTLVDVATRYYALSKDPAWTAVRTEMVGRAQAGLDALSARAQALGPRPLTSHGWCGPDIWLFTMVAWLDGLPARASGNANVTQLLSLAWTLPGPLLRWAEAFRERDDVRALG
jgi:glutathione S-transferase